MSLHLPSSPNTEFSAQENYIVGFFKNPGSSRRLEEIKKCFKKGWKSIFVMDSQSLERELESREYHRSTSEDLQSCKQFFDDAIHNKGARLPEVIRRLCDHEMLMLFLRFESFLLETALRRNNELEQELLQDEKEKKTSGRNKIAKILLATGALIGGSLALQKNNVFAQDTSVVQTTASPSSAADLEVDSVVASQVVSSVINSKETSDLLQPIVSESLQSTTSSELIDREENSVKQPAVEPDIKNDARNLDPFGFGVSIDPLPRQSYLGKLGEATGTTKEKKILILLDYLQKALLINQMGKEHLQK